MNTITFDKLLLKTAFCCMAADGNIDKREISIIKSMCEKSELFKNFNFQEEINQLVTKLNTNGKAFIQYYFDLLKQTSLSEQEELTLIDFAIQTINADEQVEYSEIKFFKNIRHRLKISDEKILANFPDLEPYLEEDIITDSFLDKITSQYFETTELPQFDLISISDSSQDKQ
ncbi:MAG: TerB family tellurite resistance protein [Bacteroidia bacterium]|nr:TerB family tellurite resistance protein [Bacteroidia bacterium]